jgi:hypothetical protein
MEQQTSKAATPAAIDAPKIALDGDSWYVIGRGVRREDGMTFVHLSSATRGRCVKNGVQPVQMCEWVNLADAK